MLIIFFLLFFYDCEIFYNFDPTNSTVDGYK